jgi:drug/metabolite transporter (DMT)-like permease
MSFLFLGIVLHASQWVAVILIIVANIAVSVDVRNWRQSSLLKLSSGIPFALIAACGWGLYAFFLIPISQQIGPWLAALITELGVTTAAGLHIMFSAKKIKMNQLLNPKVVVNALLLFLGIVSFTVGAKYLNVGIVAALSGSTALVSMLIGLRFFKERLKLKDRISAIIMILSVAALAVL